MFEHIGDGDGGWEDHQQVYMVLRTVERENGATLFLGLALDVAVQTSLDVRRDEREAIPRRLDQV